MDAMTEALFRLKDNAGYTVEDFLDAVNWEYGASGIEEQLVVFSPFSKCRDEYDYPAYSWNPESVFDDDGVEYSALVIYCRRGEDAMSWEEVKGVLYDSGMMNTPICFCTEEGAGEMTYWKVDECPEHMRERIKVLGEQISSDL